MTSSSAASPVIYWACQAISIDNVGGKFANQETVESNYFECNRDPNPVVFQMRLGFGVRKGKETWLTAHVINTNRDVKYRKMKFKLFNNEGKGIQYYKDADIKYIASVGGAFGWDDFYDADVLASPDQIVWRVVVELEYEGEPPVKTPVFIPTHDIGGDYLKLLESSNNSDVTFIVQGERIKAHKTVLVARSNYFESMFNSTMKESATGEIEVPDADPAAFKGMLQYLYGGSSPKDLDDVALDLYALSDKYGLKELQEVCESHILANLDAHNVVDAILLSDQYDLKKLMSAARVVLKQNLEFVQQSEHREKLEQHPKLLFELFSYFAAK